MHGVFSNNVLFVSWVSTSMAEIVIPELDPIESQADPGELDHTELADTWAQQVADNEAWVQINGNLVDDDDTDADDGPDGEQFPNVDTEIVEPLGKRHINPTNYDLYRGHYDDESEEPSSDDLPNAAADSDETDPEYLPQGKFKKYLKHILVDSDCGFGLWIGDYM
jgi:hypothetical protein